jgi:hypothetical protein
MDLTPARIIQKVRSHLEVAKDERDFQLQLAEVQTRTLAAFMAQTKEAAQAVKDINFTGKERKQDVSGPPGTAEKLAGLMHGRF